MRKMNDALRAEIARGWAVSGLSQREYAALHSISERTLRSWLARYASRQPPTNQVRSIVRGMIEKLQAVLDGLDVPGGIPGRGKVDEPAEDVSEPTSMGMPAGNEDVHENEEPNPQTASGMPSAGPACPPAPPPASAPRPRPVGAPEVPTAAPRVRRRRFFADV